MNCPFCLQELKGDILDTDLLCLHLKNQKCTFSQVQTDILTLTNLYPTDMLEIVNACLKMKQLKYLYVRKQDSFISTRIKQYLYQQNQNFIQTPVTYVTKHDGHNDKDYKQIQITIKPNQKLEEALLQIEFSDNISACQIIVQKRKDMQEQYEFLIDLNELRMNNNIFVDDCEYNRYLIQQQIRTLITDPQNKTFLFTFHEFQKVESTTQRHIIEQQKIIEEDMLPSQTILNQGGNWSFKELIFGKQSLNFFNYGVKFPGLSIGKIKNLFISPQNSSGSEEDYTKQQMKETIKKIIVKVIIRRKLCIFNRFDMQEVIIGLLQQLEYLDDIKITDEMRKQSIQKCINRYLYPHIALLPKIINDTKSQDSSIFQRFLRTMFTKNQYIMIPKRQSLTYSMLLYKNQYHHNDLPILDINNLATLQEQAQNLVKVSLLNNKTNQKLYCLTHNYEDQNITNKITNNFPVYIDSDDRNNKLNYNQLTCITGTSNNNYIYAGTNKGQLFRFIKNIPFQDQLNQTSLIDNDYNTVPKFQLYSPQQDSRNSHESASECLNNIITQLQTSDENIYYVTNDGYLGIYSLLNEQNDMFYLGYSSNLCSIHKNQILLGGEGVLQIFDIEQQRISNTIFQITDEMDYTSIYTKNNGSDPGYYHILVGKFINTNQLVVSNAVSGLHLYDLRQSETFPVSNIDLNVRLPVTCIDFNNYTKDQIAVSQYDGKFSIYDLRQNNLALQSLQSFSQSRSINNKSQIKFMSSTKIVVSLPFNYQIDILETSQMKIINEFKLDFLQNIYQYKTHPIKFDITDLTTISPYDISFLVCAGTTSDIFTLSTM